MINNLQGAKRHYNQNEFNWWSDSVALHPQFSMSLLVTSVQQHYRLWLLYLIRKAQSSRKKQEQQLGNKTDGQREESRVM